MVKRSEGHFKGLGDAKLFYQTWINPEATATLIMTHGIGEHSECYNLLAEELVAQKYNLIAWDLRGHGKSDGKRGYVADFRDYAEDHKFLIQHLEQAAHLKLPYFICGHSMGGLVALLYLLEYGIGKAKGVVLSSPLLGIAVHVPVIKDMASKFLYKYVPTLTMHNEIKYEDLSRDTEVTKNYYHDPFRHDRISSGLYIGMVENIAAVTARLGPMIDYPILMQLSGDDRIVSRPASEAFFATIASPRKKLIIYENSYHEIYNEINRDQVYSDLEGFIKETLGNSK